MTPAEVLARHEGLARTIAYEHATPSAPVEDVLQECRIALWQAAVKRPGDALDGLAAPVLRRRAAEVAHRGRPWTGEGRRGKARDPLRLAPDSVEAIVDAQGDGVLGAYEEPDPHAGARALAELPADMAAYLEGAIERGSAPNNVAKCFRAKFPHWRDAYAR